MRRVAIIASASGNGKTTLARALARRLDVRFIELDELVHGPGWTETPDDELRATVQALFRTAEDGWVCDHFYEHKLGTLILDAADTVVWLDQPVRVWLPRLARRTVRRIAGSERGPGGNRETLKTAFWGRDALFAYALRAHFRRRRAWPAKLARYPVVRLRRPSEVEEWLARA